MRLCRFIWVLIGLLVIGCSEDSVEKPEAGFDTEPPLTPQMRVHRRDIPDDLWGPDALTEIDGIHIEWDANAEDDLAGYRLYRATAPSGEFVQVVTVSKSETFYDDTDVNLEVRYCYRVAAIDEAGNESTLSEPACYTLLRKPVLTQPPNQAVLAKTPIFRWLSIGETGFYTVRVFVDTSDVEHPFRELWYYETVDFDRFEVVYNQDSTATEALMPGRQYRWRVDFETQRTVGSESNWWFFRME
jgi:hypothetical protein